MSVENVEKPLCSICKMDAKCDFITRCGHQFHHSCFSKIEIFPACPCCNIACSQSRWREKVLYDIRNMDPSAKTELLTTLNGITGIDIESGERFIPQ